MARQTEPIEVPLDGSLRLAEVERAAALLRDAVATGRDVRVDAQGLQRVDAAGLQLLLSARMTARAQGSGLEIAAPQDGALARAARDCGLAPDALGLAAGAPGLPAAPAAEGAG